MQAIIIIIIIIIIRYLLLLDIYVGRTAAGKARKTLGSF